MNVLVTGATGFLGRALIARLAEAPAVRCFALVRPGQGLDLPGTRIEADLQAELPADVIPEGADAVVHLAASRQRADGVTSRLPEQVRLHTDATARLLEAARRRGVHAFVHVSTASVFKPGDDPTAVRYEDAPLVEAPAHGYSLSKRWAEELATTYRDGFEALPIIRPATIYGPEQSSDGWLVQLAQQVGRGESVSVTPPSGNLVAPVYIDDVVDVLLRVLRTPSNTTFAVSGTPISEWALIERFAAHFGALPRIETGTDPAYSFAISNSLVDERYPERLRTPWDEGMRRTWRV